ncbi:MAG TPA: phosphoribosyl-AMP cyclohydrolase [Firmicutes bacterium]|nr:phosphoribosyl-AMP cyclohydrolase [Bacillota bacterium]
MTGNDNTNGEKIAPLSPDQLKYDDAGLIPAVIQDESTGAVLMVAYMNRESLRRTLEDGRAWFWSRSRKKYWLKGESSGNILTVRSILADCDSDTLLVRVKLEGAGVACHTGRYSCFYKPLCEPKSAPGGCAGVD